MFNFIEKKSALIGTILRQSNASYTLEACAPILTAFRHKSDRTLVVVN